MITDLQNRGVRDVFIASVDGLSGFSEAIHAVFPQTLVQRCVIHQIRHSLNYVTWKDRKAFMADLKTVYQAGTREEGEANLVRLEETWGGKYRAAIKSWQSNWEELATFFQFPQEIRRLIYTTNGGGLSQPIAPGDQEQSLFPHCAVGQEAAIFGHHG